MTIPTPTDTTRDLARRLFERELASGSGEAAEAAEAAEVGDAAQIAAAERICMRVSSGLLRWFGPYGSRALIARALTRAQAANPSLSVVRISPAQTLHLDGIPDSARAYGAKTAAEGIVALLTVLADVLGRLIGTDLATNLLEQSGISTSATNSVIESASNAHPAMKKP